MFNVDDVFMDKEANIMLRVLSYTGEGENRSYRCISEYKGDCWQGDFSAFHINKYYTKLENFSGYTIRTTGEQR